MLQQFRQIIKSAAPQSEEVISYGMPAFKQHEVLIYFAVFKNHYGFYPTSKPVEVFKDKLAPYKTSKGAIQFPLDKPLPQKLITEIVKYRIKDVSKKCNSKLLHAKNDCKKMKRKIFIIQ